MPESTYCIRACPRVAMWLALPLLASLGHVPAHARPIELPPLKRSAANPVPDCATPGRLTAYLASRNPALARRFEGIAGHYQRHGDELGLRWDFAFFQMMVETANLTFRRANGQPGTVGPSQNNFAGLGATGGGEPGERFADVSSGVKAHLQHLQLYAGEKVANPIAERTRKVQEWGILANWHASLRRQTHFGDLAAKWAPMDVGYAAGIAAVARRFYDGFCQLPDPKPSPEPTRAPVSVPEPAPVAQVAPPAPIPAPAIVEAPAEPASPPEPKVSGVDLARQANERAREAGEPNTRWGLGMAESLQPVPAPRKAPPDEIKILNSTVPEAAEPRPEPAPVQAAAPAPAPAPVQIMRRVAPIHARLSPAPGGAASGQHGTSALNPADEAIRTLVSGRTVLIDAALGMSIPVLFRPDGTMRGSGGGLSYLLGASMDDGRWWVQRGRLCKRWNVWLDRETQCLRLRQAGAVIHWVRDDGKSGTARFASR